MLTLKQLKQKKAELIAELRKQYVERFTTSFGDDHDEAAIGKMADAAAAAAITYAVDAMKVETDDSAVPEETMKQAVQAGFDQVSADPEHFPAQRIGKFFEGASPEGEQMQKDGHKAAAGGRSSGHSDEEPSFIRLLKAIRSGRDDELHEVDTKVFSTGVNAEGGFLIDTLQVPDIIEIADNFDAVSRWVQAGGGFVIPFDQGVGPVNWPKEASLPTAEWGGENTEATAVYGSYGQLQLAPKKVRVFTKVPIELVRRSTPAAEQSIRRMLGRALGLALGDKFLNGDGTGSTPTGIFNIAGTSTYSMAADTNGKTPGYDDYVDFFNTVEQQNAEANGLLMATRDKAIVRKIKDANGLPIFQMPRDDSGPDVLGVPTYFSGHFATNLVRGTASNASKQVCGDASSVVIARFGGIELEADTSGQAFRADQIHLKIRAFVDFAIGRPAEVAIMPWVIPA